MARGAALGVECQHIAQVTEKSPPPALIHYETRLISSTAWICVARDTALPKPSVSAPRPRSNSCPSHNAVLKQPAFTMFYKGLTSRGATIIAHPRVAVSVRPSEQRLLANVGRGCAEVERKIHSTGRVDPANERTVHLTQHFETSRHIKKTQRRSEIIEGGTYG